MVPWWQRLFFSFMAVVAAVLVTMASVSAAGLLVRSSRMYIGASEIFFSIAVVLFSSLPGWLAAIPLVLAVTNIRGVRFWIYWAAGSAIGPLLLLGLALYGFFTNPRSAGFNAGAAPLLGLALAISCLTTLFFLLLLRWAQARLARQRSADEGAEDLLV